MSRRLVISIRYCDRTSIVWISPAIIGNQRRPTGPSGVLIVRIPTESLVEFRILPNLFSIEFHAETGTCGHTDGSVLIPHQTALNDVVSKVVIMSIRGKREVWQDGSQMQHGRKLNPQFSGGMDSHTELKRFTNRRSLYAASNTAPEGCIEENDVNRSVEHIRRELLKVHDNCVGRERDLHHFPGAAHTIQAENGIL